jgi:hypothetical protein
MLHASVSLEADKRVEFDAPTLTTLTCGGTMARKTVLISDQSGQTIPDGKGAKVRITFNDARKGVRELDLTDGEAEALGGRPVARRGRRPKTS